MRLNKLHWLSALFAFALVSGFILHLIFSSDAIPQGQSLTNPNSFAEQAPSEQNNSHKLQR